MPDHRKSDSENIPERSDKLDPAEKRVERTLRKDIRATDMEQHVEAATTEARNKKAFREQGGRTETHKDFGTPSLDGIIEGGPPTRRDLLANKGSEASEKKERSEKLIPKDGDNISWNDYLTKYRSPVMDQYEQSRKKLTGDVGKSDILENTIDRFQKCPWADKVRIKFDSNAINPEYDNATSTITLNPKDSYWDQIRTFSHEGYHATHQTLSGLYYNALPVSKDSFERILGTREARAYENEILLYNELKGVRFGDGQDAKPPRFRNVLENPFQHIEHTDLSAIYSKSGFEGLQSFIVDAKPPKIENGRVVNNMLGFTEKADSYRQTYQRTYDSYANPKTYSNAQVKAQKLFDDWRIKHPGKSIAEFDY